MPIYEYRASSAASCEHCRERFEELQGLRDAALRKCSRCGAPVERVVSAARTPQRSIDISDRRVEQAGFTRYQKRGRGYYEKTAGRGPRGIVKGRE